MPAKEKTFLTVLRERTIGTFHSEQLDMRGL